MLTQLKIGYFKHWSQPEYRFVNWLYEQDVYLEQINYSKAGYLEKYDIAIIEQNGFNDYIENDELYIRDWVKRGGILLFLHQDYQRWAPYFLPEEVGYTQLIHRYIPTINGGERSAGMYMSYMMPWIEESGRRLFSDPEQITPDEMLDWRIIGNSFRITRIPGAGPEELRTAAQSCYLLPENWEIIGSYMDPAVRDGALIARARYGKGMFFLNQLLFPEKETPEADRCFAFWKKYIRNLMAYFERFRNGDSEQCFSPRPAVLPIKKNYAMCIHMHSLDWYGCESSPGTINAMMRFMGFDICAIAVKDIAPYKGKLLTQKYSDDKVLFLDGQEYHPFNWNDHTDLYCHNSYHMLAIGVDPDAYTPEYTRSLFSDEEAMTYVKKAIRYIHKHHGAVCTAHPWTDTYWYDKDFDGADIENMSTLCHTTLERYWLSGKRRPVMNSVDLFGWRRMLDNPAVNFIYLKGETPTRDSVVKAIKAGHLIAACFFKEADITLDDFLPGDEVPLSQAKKGTLHIHARCSDSTICEVRVYAGADLIATQHLDSTEVSWDLPLKKLPLKQFIRVEIQGSKDKFHICNSTPFYLV